MNHHTQTGYQLSPYRVEASVHGTNGKAIARYYIQYSIFVTSEAGYLCIQKGRGNDVTKFVYAIITVHVTDDRVLWAFDTLQNIARLVVANTDIYVTFTAPSATDNWIAIRLVTTLSISTDLRCQFPLTNERTNERQMQSYEN
jgi:hypothetical protein